ncbi:NADP-dependent oxidoreductase [Micromonospora sp. NPDC049274]|uniref:NADP-dependent oxidoreductase n=1 Tax=Micromonospora sp. NPDC049274 TaxID=3154829 RepID=UPI00341B2D3B
MMKALRAYERDAPDTLVYEDAPVPTPVRGEVLVAVSAAGITFAELGWEQSWRTADGGDRIPMIPSHEVSGVVAATGEAVTDLAVGDEVYGLIDFNRNGAAAEFVTVDASALAHRPRRIGHVETAALPLAALTAWQALHDHARIASGEHVLIHGGAGGVGAFAVQLAALHGARVTATAREADAVLLGELGATRVIDYTKRPFEAEVSDVDVVIDTVGGETLVRSVAVLRPGGRLVTLSAPPSAGLGEERKATLMFFVVTPSRSQSARLAQLVDDGALRVLVARTFPLSDGRQAYAGNDGHRPGKTVLTVRP